MNIYTIALFAHVVGAIGAFVGVSVWLFAAEALRRARRVGQVRALISLIQPSGVVAIASIILIGVAGLYMAQTTWGTQAPWIVVATISFLLLAPFGAFVIDPRLRTLAKLIALAPEGPLPAALAVRTHDPLVGCRTLHLHRRVARYRLPDDDQAVPGNLHPGNARCDGDWAGYGSAALVDGALKRAGDASGA